MSGVAQPKLDYESLETFLLGVDADMRRWANTERRVAAGAVAHAIGISTQTVYRWTRDGVPLFNADRAAIRLGVHPVLIWPDFHKETPCPT